MKMTDNEVESLMASKRWLEKQRKQKGKLGERQCRRLKYVDSRLKEYPVEAKKEIRNLERDVKKERKKKMRYRKVSREAGIILDRLAGV